MRDKVKEEELRETDDSRYSHLTKPLFVEISTVATPAEAYARIGYALKEIRKYIFPDKNDEISQQQLQEAMEFDPSLIKNQSSAINGYKYLKLFKNNKPNELENKKRKFFFKSY